MKLRIQRISYDKCQDLSTVYGFWKAIKQFVAFIKHAVLGTRKFSLRILKSRHFLEG